MFTSQVNGWTRARSLFTLLAVLGAGDLAAADLSDDGGVEGRNRHVWQPRTSSVAVFKNGYGFFIREGAVALREGWCSAESIPPAAFGTLAIYAHEEGRYVDVVGAGPGEVVAFDGQDAPADEASIRARLATYLNVKLQVTYGKKAQERTAAGRLASVGPEYCVLENAGNNLAVPVAEITRLQLLDMPLRVHVRDAEEGIPEGGVLGMAYLREGITWIPEYTLRILDDETAELVLRGTLVNEAEDLIHADVHFVVGVPSFLHTDYLAPIAVGQVIRTIGAATAPPQVMRQISNRSALVFDNVAVPANAVDVTEYPAEAPGGRLANIVGSLPQLSGAAATDYAVYTKRDLTVRRGERAIVTLFTQRIRYGHVYRWDGAQPLEHFLVLHNDTPTAWTTGPLLALSGDQPLSEGLLTYTARGSAGEFSVTAAVNIACSRREIEGERKLKAHSPKHDVFFDLVELHGELKLRNFEEKPVDVIVTASVRGKPTDASDDGRVYVNTDELRLLERSGRLDWRITLAPGAEKTLSYRYERYVPSN